MNPFGALVRWVAAWSHRQKALACALVGCALFGLMGLVQQEDTNFRARAVQVTATIRNAEEKCGDESCSRRIQIEFATSEGKQVETTIRTDDSAYAKRVMAEGKTVGVLYDPSHESDVRLADFNQQSGKTMVWLAVTGAFAMGGALFYGWSAYADHLDAAEPANERGV